MPMPKPNGDESHSDFMSRCMGDDMMMGEHPDKDERAAICQRQWESGKSVEPVYRHKAVKATIEPADGQMQVVSIINTADVDRDGEVLVPSGCKLESFRKNPVVLWNHDRYQPPIGKCLWIKATSTSVRALTQFAHTPLGFEIFSLIKGEFLRTYSVGYNAASWRTPTAREKRDGATRATDDWELFEYSVVPIPSNPNALTEAVSKGYAPLSSYMRECLLTTQPEGAYSPHTRPDARPARRRLVVG